MPSLPPHIAWPGLVVFILLIGIGGGMSILYYAQTDGGPQIVEDYYTQAADWNDTMRVQASTLRLGWQANVRLDDRFGSSE
ncbi:MAG: FixH family protein, partial [Bacteroidota bacterium]